MKVTAIVVTYDSVRRKGFMRIDDPSTVSTVHFALGMLLPGFKSKIIEASKAINKAKAAKERMNSVEFRQLLKSVSSLIVGQRFSFEIKMLENGKWNIKRKTVEHLAGLDS